MCFHVSSNWGLSLVFDVIEMTIDSVHYPIEGLTYILDTTIIACEEIDEIIGMTNGMLDAFELSIVLFVCN